MATNRWGNKGMLGIVRVAWGREGVRGKGGRAWREGGVHARWACVAGGGMCGRGVHGGVAGGRLCVAGGGMRGIRSMSGRYASYWNAFLS